MKGAEEVAENVRKAVEDSTMTTEDGDITSVTVSIGVNSVLPTAETSTEDFIKAADKALYDAKESGRNRVVLVKD